MLGKRLIDIAALFSASRGVAQQHAALRSSQINLLSKSSSLGKLLRYQTDRITYTAKAASFFASRFRDDLPGWHQGNQFSDAAHQNQLKESQDSHQSAGVSPSVIDEGRDQDIFYNSSLDNSVNTPLQTASINVKQAAAACNPLADGTIPPTPAELNRNLHETSLSLSRGPRDYLQSSVKGHSQTSTSEVREPAAKNSGQRQRQPETSRDVEPIESQPWQTTESDMLLPSVEAIPEQYSISEGIDTALFHSPRVAKIIGERTQSQSRLALKLKGAKDTPIDHGILANGTDQETFNVRTSSQTQPASNLGSLKEQEIDAREPMAGSPDDSTSSSSSTVRSDATRHSEERVIMLQESRVPSSRLSRLWNYGGLAAGMFGGVVGESFRRFGGGGSQGSYILTAGNMDRLVRKLSRMRGAALKLGQMISFQDSRMLPGPLQEVLQRVQDGADYMPAWQRDKVLSKDLGSDWRDLFSSFDEKPMAAASIGQVHNAVLKANGARVAVKVQYPGVADSIDSDLDNLSLLLTASRLLPKGLYLDKTIANARTELAWECDYVREAECGMRFKHLLADETENFAIPHVYREASNKQVLTMELMHGTAVTKLLNLSQEQKDWIGTQILRLCLREIMEFKFMQTDPNWTNFLYNTQTNKLELLDFGASREYPRDFISRYVQLLAAASRSDRKSLRQLSIDLGYLNGQESKTMLEAHITSVLTLAEPFLVSSPEIYDFKDQTITERVKRQIPVMIKERLKPPPEETYSLHRKLSGAFLLCARLGSRVPCRKLFVDSMTNSNLLSM